MCSHFRDLRSEERYLIITPYVDLLEYPEYISNWENVDLDLLPRHAIGVATLNVVRYMSFYIIDESLVDGTYHSILKGSIVTGRFIEKNAWLSKSLPARYKLFILHIEDRIIFRKILAINSEKQTFLCQALNPDRMRYPDLEIEMQQIKELYTIEVVTNYPE